MASGRPYRQLSLDAMKAKVSDSPGNRVLLEEIHHELTFRTTPAAMRFAGHVKALLVGGGDSPKPVKKARKKASPAPSAPSETPESSSPPPAGSDLDTRYSALRATFTAEAEILSRWGMTSLASASVRETVFSYWQKVLGEQDEAHPLGLSSEDLQRDMQALVEERRDES